VPSTCATKSPVPIAISFISWNIGTDLQTRVRAAASLFPCNSPPRLFINFHSRQASHSGFTFQVHIGRCIIARAQHLSIDLAKNEICATISARKICNRISALVISAPRTPRATK
jgi:hypothetical protein